MIESRVARYGLRSRRVMIGRKYVTGRRREIVKKKKDVDATRGINDETRSVR